MCVCAGVGEWLSLEGQVAVLQKSLFYFCLFPGCGGLDKMTYFYAPISIFDLLVQSPEALPKTHTKKKVGKS